MGRMCYYDPEMGFVLYPDIPEEKHMTNADNLHLMPIDDLAALCASPCPPDQTCGRNTVAPLPECVECWRRWLESEADNG